MSNYTLAFSDPLKTTISLNSSGAGFIGPVGSTSSPVLNISLALYGQNHTQWGSGFDNNQLYLLESFAGASTPPSPVEGQIWYTVRAYRYCTANSTWYFWNYTLQTWSTMSTPPSYANFASFPTSAVINSYARATDTGALYQFIQQGAPNNLTAPAWIQRRYDTVPADPTTIVGSPNYYPTSYVRYYNTGRGWVNPSLVTSVTATADIPYGNRGVVDGEIWFDSTKGVMSLYDGLTGLPRPVIDPNVASPIFVPTTGGTITSGTLTISSLTANSFIYSGAGGTLTTTTAPTNSQVLVGRSGLAPVAMTLQAGTGMNLNNTGAAIIFNNTGVTALNNFGGLNISASTGSINISNAGVLTFNTRAGAVTLTSTDVTSALGYTPYNPASGVVTSVNAVSGNSGISVSGGPITTSGTLTISGNLFTSGAQGDVPASGGGTTNYLRADGGWHSALQTATITAGAGLSGGGTISGSGGSVTLNNTGVTAIYAGTNISVSANTGGVTVNSTAVAPTSSVHWSYGNVLQNTGSNSVLNFQSANSSPVGLSSYSGGTVVVGTSGYYFISANVTVGYNGGASGAGSHIQVFINGAGQYAQNRWTENNNTGEWSSLSVSGIFYVYAGQTIAIHYTNEYNCYCFGGYGSFCGFRIA